MILDTLKAKAWMLAACAAGGLLVVAAWQLHAARADLVTATTTLATERQHRAEQETTRMQVALADAKAVFRKQEIHTTNQTEITNAQTQQDRTRTAAVAAARVDADGLRRQIAAYTAPRGGSETQGDGAACIDLQHRAATLGELLGQANGLAGDFAAAAEQHADEVRTLKAVVLNDRALLAPEGAP